LHASASVTASSRVMVIDALLLKLPRISADWLSAHNLGFSITLQIEECCEVGVVDASCGGFDENRFCMPGDAKTGAAYHRDVVGAVADGKRLRKRNAALG